MRYNEYHAAQINAAAAPGYSSGQAMKALEDVFAQTMPREMGFDYSGMSYQEQKAAQGVPPSAIFGLSLLFVFLILAAQYESWSLPFSVLLGTPDRGLRRLSHTVAPSFRKQRLRANRTGHADRPGGQERDSDRRIRQSPNTRKAGPSKRPRSPAPGSVCGRF